MAVVEGVEGVIGVSIPGLLLNRHRPAATQKQFPMPDDHGEWDSSIFSATSVVSCIEKF